MTRILIVNNLILLVLTLVSCKKNLNTPKTAYNKWFTAWKNHDGKTIKNHTALVHSYASTPLYWQETSKNSFRKAIQLSKNTDINYQYKYETQWTDQIVIKDNHFQKIPYFIYNQKKPINTVKSLILAIKMKRWNIIKSLLVEEVRFNLSKKMIRKMFSTKNIDFFVKRVEKALQYPMVQKENIAKLIYDSTKSIVLRQMASKWYIVTLE